MKDGRRVNLTEVEDGKFGTNEYKLLPLYMQTLEGKVTVVVGEFHVVNHLSCGILISNNVICPNRIELKCASTKTKNKDVIRVGEAKIEVQMTKVPIPKPDPTFCKAKVIANKKVLIKPGYGALIAIRIKGHIPPNTFAFLKPS